MLSVSLNQKVSLFQLLCARPGRNLRASPRGAIISHPCRGSRTGKQHSLWLVRWRVVRGPQILPAIAIVSATLCLAHLAASLQDIGLALDTALSIRAGTLWINCHNMFDAASGFGGQKESGIGREGGKEGLYAYVRPAGKDPPRVSLTAEEKSAAWGESLAAIPGPPVGVASSQTMPPIDRTPKMYGVHPQEFQVRAPDLAHEDLVVIRYIGGAQKRPDGYSQLFCVYVEFGTVPNSKRFVLSATTRT